MSRVAPSAQAHGERSMLALQTSHSSGSAVRQRSLQELQRTLGNDYVQNALGARRAAHEAAEEPGGPAGLQRDPAKETSPEEELIEDIETGVEQANTYFNYINEAIEVWQENGGPMPGELARAADNIKKITGRISDGLDKASGVIGKAKTVLQIRRWAEKMGGFADATRALDLGDRASIEAWIASTEELASASKPFVESAKGWLEGLAMKGSPVAARASVVLSVVGAYAEVGMAALKAGLKNVNAYVDRFGFEAVDKRITEMAEGKKKRPLPPYPGDWMSAAETRAMWEAMERDRIRREKLAPFVAELRAARTRLEAAKRVFDEKAFRKVYVKRRAKLLWRILREIKTGKTRWRLTDPELKGSMVARGLAETRWWDCFQDSGAEDYFDEIAGMYITPKRESVGAEAAEREIDDFKSVDPPCPFFNEMYLTALDKYLTKEKAAVKNAEEALDKADAGLR